VRFVDLDESLEEELLRHLTGSSAIVIGRCATSTEPPRAILDALDVTLVETDATSEVPAQCVAVGDLAAASADLERAIVDSTPAAVALTDLLRRTATCSVPDALVAESLAYSTLLGSPRFARWRASRPVGSDPGPVGPAVLVQRVEDTLHVTLNRPERHNAFGRWMRDAACDALDLALLDDSIELVRVSGSGASFCSGGDLDEFGTQTDLAAAHFIRTTRSVGRRLHDLGPRASVEVHGACVGAGTELPAFAAWVLAREDAWFQLPELAMGLIPGAGGTVSLPRRIGRWRTAWLALTGARIDVKTALAWGLVDDRAEL
jgi:Enoyl-CoA hydratase/isomerase